MGGDINKPPQPQNRTGSRGPRPPDGCAEDDHCALPRRSRNRVRPGSRFAPPHSPQLDTVEPGSPKPSLLKTATTFFPDRGTAIVVRGRRRDAVPRRAARRDASHSSRDRAPARGVVRTVLLARIAVRGTAIVPHRPGGLLPPRRPPPPQQQRAAPRPWRTSRLPLRRSDGPPLRRRVIAWGPWRGPGPTMCVLQVRPWGLP